MRTSCATTNTATWRASTLRFETLSSFTWTMDPRGPTAKRSVLSSVIRSWPRELTFTTAVSSMSSTFKLRSARRTKRSSGRIFKRSNKTPNSRSLSLTSVSAPLKPKKPSWLPESRRPASTCNQSGRKKSALNKTLKPDLLKLGKKRRSARTP